MKKMSKKLHSDWSLKLPPYVELKDKRYVRYSIQLRENGFCDPETWSLDNTICRFILPRLIRFKQINNGYPPLLTPKKWDKMLDQMIFTFDWSLNCEDDKYDKLTTIQKNKNWLKYEQGMQIFVKYFRHLWW